MGARQAVPLIPSKPSGPTRLLSYKQRRSVSPLFATLTKTAGVSLLCFPLWNSSSPQTLRTSAYSATLHAPFPPLFRPPHPSQANKAQFPHLCFQSFAHSSAISWGWGRALLAATSASSTILAAHPPPRLEPSPAAALRCGNPFLFF